MSKVKRTWVVPPARDPDTGEVLPHYDRQQALAIMEEIEPLLFMAGGMVAFVADRVQVGEVEGEPLAMSERLIVTWQPYSPMRRAGGRHFVGEVEVRPDPSPDELEAAIAAEAAALDEPLGDDEDEDDIDRSLTTTGPARPDAEFE